MIKPWTKKSGKVEPSGDSELEMTGEDNVASPKSSIKVMAGFPMTSERQVSPATAFKL